MRELIGSVMVSSPLLLTFGTLSLLLYFRLPSKGRSITTLGTRWHDFFFITLFRYFTIVLLFTLHFFSFSQGMQTRERAHCARSVFPFIKKKKKKVSGFYLFCIYLVNFVLVFLYPVSLWSGASR